MEHILTTEALPNPDLIGLLCGGLQEFLEIESGRCRNPRHMGVAESIA
jgi:hypothetical protein